MILAVQRHLKHRFANAYALRLAPEFAFDDPVRRPALIGSGNELLAGLAERVPGDVPATVREQVFQGNARRVYPRLEAVLGARTNG